MSTKLSVENFFDLDNFKHREIFKGCQFVWETVSKIESYILDLFKSGKIKPNYGENIYVGEGTIIEPEVFIKGPVIIGENCHLNHAAYLRGNVLVGDNCVVGHGVEVKNTIFLPGAISAHLNYIGDSILGNDVNVAAGTILANFRLDKQSIKVRVDDEVYETGLEKFGAIIGDDSQIGVNSALNPGTILGKICRVYPLTSVKGYHPAESVIR